MKAQVPITLSALLVTLALSVPTAADVGDASSQVKVRPAKPVTNTTRDTRQSPLPGYSLEREAAAMTFVQQHHPELSDLLQRLKSSDRGEYQKAIRDLFRTSERLANIRERNPERYELEIEHWKLKSRIQVMAAKATMGISTGHESELREALAQQADLQLRMLQLERQQLAQRLERVDSNIDQLRQGRDEHVERQLKMLLGHDRPRASVGQAGKKAARRASSESGSKNTSNSD